MGRWLALAAILVSKMESLFAAGLNGPLQQNPPLADTAGPRAQVRFTPCEAENFTGPTKLVFKNLNNLFAVSHKRDVHVTSFPGRTAYIAIA
jgi:hypothetical protein